ncbi:MAG: hypothetical protein M1500_00275 [Candidatus Marsarchaeota archaeon]|nr:hypothetical protein [Candidatus Marsarchaeota archaeon]MCL5112142.1 hypothetical protein [Candidatus Marsarchaeota archaeon]
MNQKAVTFVSLLIASAVVVGIAAMLPISLVPGYGKAVLLLVGLALDFLAFTSRYYSYLLGPMIKQRKKPVILSKENAYWLSPSSDSIMRKENETFVSTVYVSIPVYSSATEMSDEQKLNFVNQVSRLVSTAKDPTRFTTQLYVMNKDAAIQTIRAAQNDAETEEARLVQSNAKQSEVERAKGKSSMWRGMMDNIGSVTSYELFSYACVSASGMKEFEASSLAQQKAKELMAAIGATFGVSPSIVTGTELLKLVEPEYLIPVSTMHEKINKDIQEEVI